MAAIQSETSARYPGSARGSFAPVQDLVGRMREDKGLMRRVLMIGGVAIVAIAALAFWLMGGRYVSTDDAYVQTAKLMVSTDVSGLVKTVNVREGQHVRRGRSSSRSIRIPSRSLWTMQKPSSVRLCRPSKRPSPIIRAC